MSSKGRDWFEARYGKAAADFLYGEADEPDREPSAEQERAWDEQYDGTSLGT